MGFVTCNETVKLNDRAHTIEFLTHEYSGKHGYKCEEVGPIEVTAIPGESSGEKGFSVLDIKLMNEARKMGATHVLRFPSREWPCDKDGTDNPESTRTCSKMGATGYMCMVGRGT